MASADQGATEPRLGGTTPVLVVEDSALCARNVALILQQEGFEPLMPADVSEARHLVQRVGPAAAVVSLDLPLEPLALLLRDLHGPGHASFRGVLATTEGRQLTAEKARFVERCNIEHLVHKPLETQELLAGLTSIVAAPQERRKAFRRSMTMTVRYRLPGDHARLGVSRDLSLGGVRIAAGNGRGQEGDQVALSLYLREGMALELTGTIRRVINTTGGPEWGIAFDGLEDGHRDSLLSLLFGAKWDWAVLPARPSVTGDLVGA